MTASILHRSKEVRLHVRLSFRTLKRLSNRSLEHSSDPTREHSSARTLQSSSKSSQGGETIARSYTLNKAVQRLTSSSEERGFHLTRRWRRAQLLEVSTRDPGTIDSFSGRNPVLRGKRALPHLSACCCCAANLFFAAAFCLAVSVTLCASPS